MNQGTKKKDGCIVLFCFFCMFFFYLGFQTGSMIQNIGTALVNFIFIKNNASEFFNGKKQSFRKYSNFWFYFYFLNK